MFSSSHGTLLFLLVRLVSASASPHDTCTYVTTFPHLSVVNLFGPQTLVQVPITLHYRCTASSSTPLVSRRRALVPLVPGALGRASDYSALATVLARRGFVVAIPQYDSRLLIRFNPLFAPLLAIVERSLAAGYDCPPNAQLASTKLFARSVNFSLLFYARDRTLNGFTNDFLLCRPACVFATLAITQYAVFSSWTEASPGLACTIRCQQCASVRALFVRSAG